MNGLKVFSGNSNIPLARDITTHLHVALGKANVSTFSDGEIMVEIQENVRGMDVFIVQSICEPVNKHLMELLIIIDALKRASAERITATIPYYAYARQDRKVSPRVPITAKLVADLLTTAGANRVLTMDLHAGQIQGFFNIPVDNLFASPITLKYLRSKYNGHELVIVSPDAGGVERARNMAKNLGAGLAIIDKRRLRANEAEVMNIIGDIDGKHCLILDDMVDTAGTLTKAADALCSRGAVSIAACCTHPVLSGAAVEKINASCIEELIVTDTIPLNERAQCSSKIKVLSIAGLFAEAIQRIHNNDSVSSLFTVA
ncbi:MAG: ribose-phosphate pyrophosphokinase [Desulfobacterota bacterium]|nr:ribose-phosphate pyrophosphokinase [Thermodesulfobacteriota bacterium]